MNTTLTNLTARDLMNQHVFTVRADWTIHDLAEFLIDKNISGAPVVDESHNLVGVVSETDIVRKDSEDLGHVFRTSPHELYVHGWESSLAAKDLSSLQIEEERERSVREIMSTSILSIHESAPVEDIADTMIRSRVHRLLVTSSGRLVGVVTAMDLVALFKKISQFSVRQGHSAQSPF